MTAARPLAALALVLVATACAKPAPPAAAGAGFAPDRFILRTSMDTDPAAYIGRFLPSGAVDLDEAAAMTLACSRFIVPTVVDGGGVEVTERMAVNTAVAARFGVPAVVGAKGQAARASDARVEYVQTRKMIGEIRDPEGFAACCRAQPDQCTDRYVGEFLMGTGTVEMQRTQSASVGGSGAAAGGAGGGSAEAGSAWERAMRFPTPVYFAWKVGTTPFLQGRASVCPPWVQTPPTDAAGVVVVGSSRPSRSEEAALRNARFSAMTRLVQAAGPGPDGTPLVTAPASEERARCVEPVKDGGETRYIGHLLVFSSHDALARARAASAALVEAALGTPGDEVRAPVSPPALPAPSPALRPDLVLPGTTRLPVLPPAPSAGAAALVAALGGAAFSDEKLALVESAVAAGLRVDCATAGGVLAQFDFSGDRLSALVLLRPALTDPQNGRALVEQFDFAADKAQAAKILGQLSGL